MKEMARDVAPFLFDAADARKVEMFVRYLEQVKI